MVGASVNIALNVINNLYIEITKSELCLCQCIKSPDLPVKKDNMTDFTCSLMKDVRQNNEIIYKLIYN